MTHQLDWIAIWNALDRLWPDGTPSYQPADHPRTEDELAEWAADHPEAWQRLRADMPDLPQLERRART